MLNTTEKKRFQGFIIRILIGFVAYIVLVSLLIHFEQDSAQSSLTNYTNALWYTIVTLTTVGYGDLYPVTIYGRIVGYVFVFLSIGVYGLLIGQFANIMSTIKENKMLGYNGTTFESHVVIIGWSEFGQMVTDQLLGAFKNVGIVTDKKEDIEFIKEKYDKKRVYTLYCDFQNYELMKKANLERSTVVFVNLQDDTQKLVFVLNMKKIYQGLEYVVTLENSNLKNTFLNAGVTNAISPHEVSSKILASYMFEPDVAAYTEDIMSFALTPTDYDIKQFLVTYDNPFLNKPYQETFFELKKRYNAILIGMSKKDKAGKRRLLKNPIGDIDINLGDYLLVIVNGNSFKLLQRTFNVQEGYFKDS